MEGADTRVAAVFYMSVVQAVILFDSESWFLYTAMDKMRKGHTLGYCKKNHEKSGTADGGQDVGDTGIGGSMGSGGDQVGVHLHWLQTGDGGSGGGAAANI